MIKKSGVPFLELDMAITCPNSEVISMVLFCEKNTKVLVVILKDPYLNILKTQIFDFVILSDLYSCKLPWVVTIQFEDIYSVNFGDVPTCLCILLMRQHHCVDG